MKIKIEKAKIVKGATLAVDGVEINDANEESNVSRDWPKVAIHPDLKQSFDNLVIHLAVLSGCIPAKSVKDISLPPENLIEGFNVTSFSTGKDNEGIVISGSRKLANGKSFNFNTPYYLFEEKEESRYVFMDDLIEKLNRCRSEISSFIDGKKRGSEAQLSLFEGKKPVKNIQVAEPEGTVKVYKDAGLVAADPEAMKRVAEMDAQDVEVIEEIPNAPKKKAGRPKKVAQSADHPSGEVPEAPLLDSPDDIGVAIP